MSPDFEDGNRTKEDVGGSTLPNYGKELFNEHFVS